MRLGLQFTRRHLGLRRVPTFLARRCRPTRREIEIKLLVDANRLADFNDAPIVATKARNKGTRKHLKSVYYDTPERTFWRNGLSLRVRQSGAQFVQTVKTEFEGNPLRRGEWEANVASIAPDVALALPFIPANFAPISDVTSLRRCSPPTSTGTSASLTCRPARSRLRSTTAF